MSSRRSVFHPSRKRLAEWLAGDVVDEGLERHLDHCERCADVIEDLAATGDGLDGERFDHELADAIREVYEPPADLDERVVRSVAERRRADEEFGLFVGMFGVATDALELLAGGDRDRRPGDARSDRSKDGPGDGPAEGVEEP